MREYTKRRNINRGYMKLEVWQDAMGLHKLVNSMLNETSSLDLKSKGQLLDASASVPSNISEGYCRRTINEYLQFLNIALGSLGETMTRVIAMKETGRVRTGSFEEFDEFHYKVENKLLALVKSLQSKRRTDSWDENVH